MRSLICIGASRISLYLETRDISLLKLYLDVRLKPAIYLKICLAGTSPILSSLLICSKSKCCAIAVIVHLLCKSNDNKLMQYELFYETLSNQHESFFILIVLKSHGLFMKQSLFTFQKLAYSNTLRILPSKSGNFQMKNSGSFHISAQDIDCWYLFEPSG